MRKKLEENWEAINIFRKKLRHQTKDPTADFKTVLKISEGINVITIPFRYRKKNGNKSWMKKEYEIDCFVEFCPFTGLPLFETIKEKSYCNFCARECDADSNLCDICKSDEI